MLPILFVGVNNVEQVVQPESGVTVPNKGLFI